MVKYDYDAWGAHRVLSNTGATITDTQHIGHKNPFRYRGYFYDRETGLYYLKSRYYDPETCRFINMDSVEYADPSYLHGLNLYDYCNNNPIMYVDPNGHEWWQWLLGAVVVGVAAIVTAGVAGGVALALGATAATVNTVMVGATVGGLVAGSTNLMVQGITSDWQTVDYGALALSTFAGGTSGAISAGIGQLSAGVVSGTQLLAHKGFQTAVNCILSWSGYLFSSVVGGKEVTLDGFILSTVGGFVSGVTFNWSSIPALGLLLGLEFTGYTKDVVDYIRNPLKNTR